MTVAQKWMVAAALIGLAVLALRGTAVAKVVSAATGGTRGLRNHNPGNLRYVPSIKWRGQVGQDDAGYAVFDSDLNGLRAMYLDLWDDFHRDGARTVRELVSVYAPSHENPTNAYVTFVARSLGVGPDQQLNWDTHELPMRKAMVAFENGSNPFPDSLFRQARAESGKA